MTDVTTVTLSDPRHFSPISGLWSGKRPPFDSVRVLRSTDFRGDGQFDYDGVPVLEVETRQMEQRQLRRGDIVVERSGGGPKQPVGRVAYFDPPDGNAYATSNFTTALRVTNSAALDPEYVCLFLHARYLSGATTSLQRATTGIRNLDWGEYLSIEVPLLPIHEQRAIARLASSLQRLLRVHESLAQTLASLKHATMKALFMYGPRGGPATETEIGLSPRDWQIQRLDRHATVVSTRMTYSALAAAEPSSAHDAITVLGVKVSDMNLPGNEVDLSDSVLKKKLPRPVAESKCAPPGTILFPKRGAAIATNKKRVAQGWTVFDPNVIGVVAGSDLDRRFLFHWFQAFDLRTITEPGPTPQLNKKNLEPLLIPIPPTLSEQAAVAAVLDSISGKIEVHRRKRAVLDELFKALLHKLMTGEIRVSDLDPDRAANKRNCLGGRIDVQR